MIIDKNTGFFNATKLCKQSKKQYSHWFRLDKTKELIKYLKSCPPHVEGSFSYEKSIPNNVELNKIISGTYVCKELILDLASWISPAFYLKCNDIILNYFEREYKNSLKEKDDKIDELFKQNKNIINQNNNLIKKVEESTNEIILVRKQNTLALKRLEEMG